MVDKTLKIKHISTIMNLENKQVKITIPSLQYTEN